MRINELRLSQLDCVFVLIEVIFVNFSISKKGVDFFIIDPSFILLVQENIEEKFVSAHVLEHFPKFIRVVAHKEYFFDVCENIVLLILSIDHFKSIYFLLLKMDLLKELFFLSLESLLNTIYSVLNNLFLSVAKLDHFVKILDIKEFLIAFLSIFPKNHLF